LLPDEEYRIPRILQRNIFLGVANNGPQRQDNGLDINLNCFINQIVKVLKQDDGPEETLQAALMAVNIPNDEYRQEPPARNGSRLQRGAGQQSSCDLKPPFYSKIYHFFLK
jgi:hypothetical protein